MLSVLLNERSQGKQTGIVGALAFGGALSGASRLERGLQGAACMPAATRGQCRTAEGAREAAEPARGEPVAGLPLSSFLSLL